MGSSVHRTTPLHTSGTSMAGGGSKHFLNNTKEARDLNICESPTEDGQNVANRTTEDTKAMNK